MDLYNIFAKKRILYFFIILHILLYVTYAENDDGNVLITIKDISDYTNVHSVVVYMNVDDQELNQYLEDGQILKLKLENGSHYITFRVDNLSTKGKDYYAQENLIVDNNLIKTVLLYPSGSIRGIVKDKLDNVISYAKLKFECSGVNLVDFPGNTDEFGSFYIEFVPVGHCKILANYKEGVGFADIEVEKGSLKDVEINLDMVLVSSKDHSFFGIAILFIAIISLVFYYHRNQINSLLTKGKKKGKETEELKCMIKLGKREEDILETLKDKEKQIVEFIVSQNGKTTQSKIFNETGIPKASLFRYIQSLKNKQIIEVIEIGKMRKIILTKWFLSHE